MNSTSPPIENPSRPFCESGKPVARWTSILCLIPLIIIVCNACSTPQPVKDLSRTIRQKSPELAKSYKADLEATRDFTLKSEKEFNQLRAEIAHRDECLKVAIEALAQAQVDAARSNILSEFDHQAFEMLTARFDDALKTHFLPLLGGKEAQLKAQRVKADIILSKDPTSALALDSLGRANSQLALFHDAAQTRIDDLKDNLIARLKQERLSLVVSMNASLPSSRKAYGSFESLREKLSTGPITTNVVNFTDQVTNLNARILALQEFQNSSAAAQAKLDEYLVNDGYSWILTASFLQGLLTPFADNLDKARDLITGQLALHVPSGKVSGSDFAPLFQGFEQLPKITSTLSAQVKTRLDTAESDVFSRMVGLATDTLKIDGTTGSQAVGKLTKSIKP
jgi:hypothetical protein